MLSWIRIVLFLGLCFSPCLHAVTLTLTNGDKLSGEIVEINQNDVILASELYGDVTIPRRHISDGLPGPEQRDKLEIKVTENAAKAAPTEVKKEATEKSGEAAEARQTSEAKVAAAEEAAPQNETGEQESLLSVEERILTAKQTIDEPVKKFGEEVDEYFAWLKDGFDGIVPAGWKGRISFSAKFIESTDFNSFWSFDFRAEKDSGDHHYRIDAFYDYSKTERQDGSERKRLDKWGGEFDYKYDLSEDFFIQSNTEYFRDMVKDIDHEITQGIGIGYRIFNSPDLKLSVTPALSMQFRDIQNRVLEDNPQYLTSFYQEALYRFNKSIHIREEFNFNIDPNNTVDYEWQAKAKLIVKLSDWISTDFTYESRFDNDIPAGRPKTEERIMVGLGIPF